MHSALTSRQVNLWLHELGHNIGLQHSNGNSYTGWIAEYTDTSCAMGFGALLVDGDVPGCGGGGGAPADVARTHPQ